MNVVPCRIRSSGRQVLGKTERKESMNKTFSKGRLTADPKITMTTTGKKKAEFNLALDRVGEGADFPRIIAWEKRADFVEKYCHKGQEFLVEGHIQTGSYEGKNGKVYTTDIIADHIEFCGSKSDAPAEGVGTNQGNDDFMKIPDGIGEDIPFG